MIEHAVPKLSELIKQIAVNVINTMQLPEVVVGTVTQTEPLSISTSSQNVLPSNFLILTNAVRDYDSDMDVSWKTEDGSLVQGRKKITSRNGLTVGEKVLLFRVQGGQNYVVLDRINPIQTSGESV